MLFDFNTVNPNEGMLGSVLFSGGYLFKVVHVN